MAGIGTWRFGFHEEIADAGAFVGEAVRRDATHRAMQDGRRAAAEAREADFRRHAQREIVGVLWTHARLDDELHALDDA